MLLQLLDYAGHQVAADDAELQCPYNVCPKHVYQASEQVLALHKLCLILMPVLALARQAFGCAGSAFAACQQHSRPCCMLPCQPAGLD